MFEAAEAYEVSMGRWSRQLAPQFVQCSGVVDGDVVFDVGCGTGAQRRFTQRISSRKLKAIHGVTHPRA
jgi:ubiquinone/menaquinone biosynthesis C-methylase UbiE